MSCRYIFGSEKYYIFFMIELLLKYFEHFPMKNKMQSTTLDKVK